MVANWSFHFAVIARLDRAIQYAAASQLEASRHGVLDARFRRHDERRR